MKGWIICAAALAATLPVATGAVPVVLDFDSAPQDWISNGFVGIDAPLVEDGFVITTAGSPTDQLGVGDHTWCFPACADNGTQALRSSFAGTITLIEREDLGTFNFLGFDAAGLITDFPFLSAEAIRVTGYKADLTSVTQDFLLDSLNDGPGGVADFQTFDGLFAGLVRLTFEGIGTTGFDFSVDNIALSIGEIDPVPVPEPAGLALLAAGLGAIGWMRRRLRHHAAS